MKKLTIIIVAIFISTSAFAGNRLPFFSFGIKAGFTSNEQKINWDVFQSASSFKKAASGFHVGGLARLDFPLLPIYLQGELLYDWGKFNGVSFEGMQSGSSTNVTTNTFSVPVLLGVGIGSSSLIKIRANLGPVFNIVSDVNFSNFTDTRYEDMFRKQSVTWTAGIGIDIFRIMVDARYNGVFAKREIGSIGDLASIKTTPTSWTISVGYLF